MRGRWRVLVAKITEWIALGLIPILSALRAYYPTVAAKPTNLPEYLHQAFTEWFLTLIIVLALVGVLAKLIQEHFNPESKKRLKAALDLLLDAYFTGVPEKDRYLNRATLFKANTGHSKLQPFCRSGTQYHRGIQPLLIDDNKEAGNEGVAGQAWFRNATVSIPDLPDCPNPWSARNLACADYARKGLLPMNKAETLHVKSRSLLATPVRNFKGEQWGILVLDSRKPDSIAQDKEHLVTLFASALGKML